MRKMHYLLTVTRGYNMNTSMPYFEEYDSYDEAIKNYECVDDSDCEVTLKQATSLEKLYSGKGKLIAKKCCGCEFDVDTVDYEERWLRYA